MDQPHADADVGTTALLWSAATSAWLHATKFMRTMRLSTAQFEQLVAACNLRSESSSSISCALDSGRIHIARCGIARSAALAARQVSLLGSAVGYWSLVLALHCWHSVVSSCTRHGRMGCGLTIHSSRSRFAARLNSGVRRHAMTDPVQPWHLQLYLLLAVLRRKSAISAVRDRAAIALAFLLVVGS